MGRKAALGNIKPPLRTRLLKGLTCDDGISCKR